ncbi:MAG TPA: hypothetical protein VFC83_04580 [Erysipelotrichaceae bacterium]|nr:hypothetical protein [Erysipelotrichaceae bacterium]
MKIYHKFNKLVFVIILLLSMSLSLVACGGNGKSDMPPLVGSFESTQKDEGDGFEVIDDPYMSFGVITFNADGTGEWAYALDTTITWKLKGENLTVVETYEGSEDTWKGSYDGEKVILDVWGIKHMFEKVGNQASTKPNSSNADALLGRYECFDAKMQGNPFGASGEWLELHADGKGKWYLGAIVDDFTWKLEDDKINFDVTVDGSTSTLQYSAIVDNDEIILDTGMLYYFSKNADTAKNPTTDGGSVVWKNQPLGQITIPSLWYGVAIFSDAEGFDQSEYEYDVWGIIEKDETGKPYFEVWLDEDFSSSFLLSTYIDIQDSQWYTPTIGEDDGWLIIDPKSADYQVLSSDDEWGLMAQYHNGSLDIYHTFFGKDGGYADTRFFLREEGTGWNESVDPLPPSYQAYKQIYATGN